jgi:hypothetical protein
MAAKSKSKSALDIVELEARARGMRACRGYRVVTPRIDAVVGLLLTDDSHRIAVDVGKTPECVRWNTMKAQAIKADESQILFDNDRLARAAQRLADELKASGKAAHLSVLCLTADAAVQRLGDAKTARAGLSTAGVDVGVLSALVPEHLPQKHNHRTAASAVRRR